MLSLEEMLAEGDNNARNPNVDRQNEIPPTMTKTQIKCLQEAMYHSAENNHLGMCVCVYVCMVTVGLQQSIYFMSLHTKYVEAFCTIVPKHD